MLRPLPISCFIIALNEEDRIRRAIASVRGLVDEVIVVDGGSDDRTREVSEAEGARVVYRWWSGFGPQKRAGEEFCKHAWILNIDADECVTEALAAEIREIFREGPAQAGYNVAVNIVYPGKSRPRPWARDCRCVRLYDSRRVRFSPSMVHDRVVMGNHDAGDLTSTIHHHPVRSYSELLKKYRDRAQYCGTYEARRSRSLLGLRLPYELPMAFFRTYVARGHMTGGLSGLRYAAATALFRFWRVQSMLARSAPVASSIPASDLPRLALVRAPDVAVRGSAMLRG